MKREGEREIGTDIVLELLDLRSEWREKYFEIFCLYESALEEEFSSFLSFEKDMIWIDSILGIEKEIIGSEIFFCRIV